MRMKFGALLAVLAVLVWAGVARSGSASDSATRATFDVTFEYDQADGTEVIGESGNLPRACFRGIAYLEPGSTGTVALHGVRSRKAPWTLDASTLLALVPAGTTAGAAVEFETPARFFQAIANGTQTTESSLRIRCSNVAVRGGGGGSGSTDLGFLGAASSGTVTSSSGGNATIPGAAASASQVGGTAGLMVAADKERLDNATRWTLISAAPATPLQPGNYTVDCGAVFNIPLAETPGEWEFADSRVTAGTNTCTVGSAAQTFTNAAGVAVAGPFDLSVAGRIVKFGNLAGTAAFETIQQPGLVSGTDQFNTPLDRDGDGFPDYYHMLATGESAEAVHDAIQLLTDSGDKLFRLSGIVDSSGMVASADLTWDPNRLISIPSNMTFQCEAGSRIYGPDLPFWQDRTTFTAHLANEDGADNFVIRGCFVENTGLLAGFDPDPSGTEWGATGLFGGVHIQGANGALVEGVTVRGSPHSGFFKTRSSNVVLRGNYAYATGESFNHEGTSTTLAAPAAAGDFSLDLAAPLANCASGDWILIETDEIDPAARPGTTRRVYVGAWVETAGDPIVIRRAARATGRHPGIPFAASAGREVFCSEGDKHAFEFFTEDDAADATGNDFVAMNNVMEFNRAELISGVAFQIRGVSANEDECEDGSQVTCWHESTILRNNVGIDVNGELFQVRGSRNARVTDNTGTRTGGATFTRANQRCSEPFDDAQSSSSDAGQKECSRDTYLAGNTITDCRPNSGSGASAGGCVRFNDGHESIYWDGSNFVNGTIEGAAFFIGGDSPGSEYHLKATKIASTCIVDSLNSSAGSPLTRDLYGSLRCQDSGLAFHDGVDSNSPAVAWRSQHTGKLILDPFVVSGVVSSWMFIDPIGSYDIVAPDLYNVAVNGTWTAFGGSFASTVERDAPDGGIVCAPQWDGVTAIVADAWQRCDGAASTWVVDAPITNRDGWMVLSGNSVIGGGLYGGTITNTLAGGSSMVNLSSASGGSDGMTIRGITFRKGAEGMLSAAQPVAIQEQTGSATNVRVMNSSFEAITDANRFLGLESGDFSSESHIYDIDSPTGSCVSGTLWTEIDATATGGISLCRDGSWVSLD